MKGEQVQNTQLLILVLKASFDSDKPISYLHSTRFDAGRIVLSIRTYAMAIILRKKTPIKSSEYSSVIRSDFDSSKFDANEIGV